MTRWLALVLLVAACSNPSGRPCTRRHECGDGFLCDFPGAGRCGVAGHCRPYSELSPELVANCSGPDDDGTVSCSCDDETTGGVGYRCDEVAILVPRFDCERACGYLTKLDQAVHAGRRGVTEYCRSDPARSAFNDLLPSRCCDCSLAREGPTCANGTTGDLLPAGCCLCVTPASPDPTGRCAPPGGVFPAGSTRWCCPITDDSDGGAADGGA